MRIFFIKKFLELIPLLWVLATITFFIIRLAPGGPFDDEKALPDNIQSSVESYYGLNKPLGEQYCLFLKQVVKGDLGPSLKYPGMQVSDIILQRLPYSLELGFLSFLFALFLGVGAGFIASFKPYGFWDYGLMTVAIFGICLPSFVLGPLLNLIFAVKLNWVNATGWDSWQDKILPVSTLGFVCSAYVARLTRASMFEVKNQDYIRTAFAKGLSTWRVLGVHALKNAIQPVIAYAAPALATLITGSFVVETVFHIPGLGFCFVQGAFNRDYTLIMGVVLFYGSFLAIMNTLTDIILSFLNPKIKIG